ncbi:DZAN1 protein, partial [Bucco capensis]|nr:DZAN1 protein [Bucco capensis]
MAAGCVSVPQLIPLRLPPPGKAKHEIDTSTLIEIKSDGSKPELLRKPGSGEHNTMKYKGPIILPVGKVMVKALAVTKDCRMSTVVTKVFLVEDKQPNILFPGEDDDKNFLKELSTQEREGGMFATTPRKNGVKVQIKAAWSASESHNLGTERRTPLRSLQGPQASGSPLEAAEYREEPASALPPEPLQFATSPAVTSQKSSASTLVSRIQRETDFLKCAHCCAPRLAEPLAHFCHECGSRVPAVPVRCVAAPAAAQMAPCLECKHLVPMNTATCIVCEAPIAPQLQPQSSICIKGKVICQACGTGNPLHHKHCVTCEGKLPEIQKPLLGGHSPPPQPSQLQKTVPCSKCSRANQWDAHFCDWCGAKASVHSPFQPGPPPSYFACCKCGTTNQPYARFCGCCGGSLEPPSREHSLRGTAHSLEGSEAKGFQAQVAWQPLPISSPPSRAEPTEREDKGTQTIGLFYPSSRLLAKKELELISQREKLEKMSDHKPLLTAISPGKGYWRKQLDHICAHLRSYAQNNLEFRALLGEPRMGKMNSAAISEDDWEVTVTLNYALAVTKGSHTPKAVRFSSHDLSTATDGQEGSQTSAGNEDNVFYSRGKIKRTKPTTLAEKEDKLP